MIKNIGVMQGRLLPKYQGRYQAHPVGYWQDEFRIAGELGLAFIEFIVDYDQAEQNPLLRDSGPAEIQKITGQTGVRVKTVCADYLMDAPLHGGDESAAARSCRMLQTLLENAWKIGATDIVIPCVDRSALQNEAQMARFIKNIGPARDVAAALRMNLALETDLPPRLFAAFLASLAAEIFTVNYDTGNSAAAGYDPTEEFAAYGERISDIHLKDRLKDGASVPLGRGAADFTGFFAALLSIDYAGPLIMQAYRDDEGVRIFKEQLAWISPRIEAWQRLKQSGPARERISP
jgi:L-ribulose-5-phosphate 3-epimerase